MWTLLACAAPPAPAAESAPAEQDGPIDPPPPTFSPDAVVDALALGTSLGVPAPDDVFDVYFAMMAQGDEACPGPGDQIIDAQVPLTGCTATSGYTYAGVSVWLEDQEIAPAPATARLLGGDFQITDDAGRRFDVGGETSWIEEAKDPAIAVIAAIDGTFAYAGGPPWMAAGASAVMRMEVARVAGEAKFAGMYGGLGLLGVDLWFGPLVFDSMACATGQPAGSVDVRDPSGAWWRLDFAGECTGCGTLSYPGEPDTEACADLRSLRESVVTALPGTG